LRNRTYPKENQKKLNGIIKELKSDNLKLRKERDFYKKELDNLRKPVRTRKGHVEKPKLTDEEWNKDFILRFKREVLGEKV